MINSVLNQTNILLEYFGGPPEEEGEEVPAAIPYESIKKFMVYDRFIDLRSRLENIKDPDDDMLSIIDFITTTIQFYNSYGLDEVTNLLNNTIDIISDNWNLKVPDLLPEEPEELEGPPEGQELPTQVPQEVQQEAPPQEAPPEQAQATS
jgi:hypothetical protein